MKWLRDLVKKPPEQTGTDLTEPAPAASEAEIAALREAVASADDETRAEQERALGAALARSAREPAPEDGTGVLVAVVCELGDKAAALACLERVREQEPLAYIAAGARIAEVRLAAARRIDDPAILKHVADACRERDRGVYRHCTEALRAMRQHEERERGATEVVRALEILLQSAPLPASRLAELEKTFESLGQDTSAGPECARLLQVARTRVQDEAAALRELQQLAQHATALATEAARDEWPVEPRRQSLFDELASLRLKCSDPPAWLASHAAARALGDALDALERRLADLTQEAERAAACERFLESTTGTGASPADLESRWADLPKPEGSAARKALRDRFDELVGTAAPPPVEAPPPVPRPAPPAKRQRVDAAAAEPLLVAIEQALEQGLLSDAEAAERRLEHLMAGAGLPGALARRHGAARAQMNRLRGWARWGTDQAREHLIEEAETLLASHPDVEDLAHAVVSLREEWKRLDGHGAASGTQWQRFDRAVEKAWTPVAAHRAAEAERSAQARTAKEALCAEWEAWLAGQSPEQTDWKTLDAWCSGIARQWRSAPRAGFRDERALRKRFDALLAQVEARRKAAHEAEIARREGLIAAMDTLREESDVNRACTEARKLQASWRDEASSLRLKRSEEQRLWKRFRAACDAVFARREAQRGEQATQRQQVVEARQALLSELESALATEEPGAVETALGHFRTAWARAAPAPREAASKLDGRARELERLGRQRIDNLRRERRESRFVLLARKAGLAERVEATAAAGQAADEVLAQVRQEWEALPRLWSEAERALSQRLATAASVTTEALEAGAKQRSDMLLDLEIALGLPSPDDAAEARRERQLSNLKQHFGGGSPDVRDPEATVLRWYATAATPSPGQAQRMEAVVRGLLQAEGRRPAAG